MFLEFFNVVHTWSEGYVKYYEHSFEQMQLFPPGRTGTGKSHLVSIYQSKDPEKPKVLFLGPKGISVVKINESIIQSDLGINPICPGVFPSDHALGGGT